MALNRNIREGVPFLLAHFENAPGGSGMIWRYAGESYHSQTLGVLVAPEARFLYVVNQGPRSLYIARKRELLGTSLGVTIDPHVQMGFTIKEGLVLYAMPSKEDTGIHADTGLITYAQITLFDFDDGIVNPAVPPPLPGGKRKFLEES